MSARESAGSAQGTITGVELMREFIKHSPFAARLKLTLLELEPERALVALPFEQSLVTVADVVHGGAISTLIDVAATLASWSAADITGSPQGATISLSVDFLRAAHSETVQAEARVLRRGRTICYSDVDVVGASGQALAKGIVAYKLG
ncbi:MAG: PaaI family thioesterase [Solirubrobacterales bacterium]